MSAGVLDAVYFFVITQKEKEYVKAKRKSACTPHHHLPENELKPADCSSSVQDGRFFFVDLIVIAVILF